MSEDEIRELTNDEKIEVIQKRLKNTKFSQQYTNAPKISINYICDMETLLDLYQKEKEKNEAMNKGIDELVREKQDLKTELYMNSVSKDKIKEKMKIIENECKTCKYNHPLCEERKPLENSIKYCLKLECYDVLKSLLEEN